MPFLILFLFASLFAQESAPIWIHGEWRSAQYPSAEWYTGFAKDMAKGMPDNEKIEAVKKAAQNSLSESITIHVTSFSSIENSSKLKQNGKNTSETMNRNYKQTITSASDVVLPKLESHFYFDKESGYIYAFAAVKKNDCLQV
jgi:hypothetical protein